MKKSLSIGVILLFLLSALAPIGLGLNVTTDIVKEPETRFCDGPMDSPWPVFGHDALHTGRSPYSTADNPGTIKWKLFIEQGLESSTVIDDNGTLYVGSNGNYLYAIYPNGTEKWRYNCQHWITTSPAITDDGIIYACSWDDNLYAINPDGTLKWRIDTGGTIKSSPVIGDDDIIYFGILGPGTNNGRVYAIYPNGTEKWHYDTNDYIFTHPAIGLDGNIYVSSSDNYLYSLYSNGTLYWKYKMNDWPGSPTISDNGIIYIPSQDDNLYAIYTNGTLKWKIKIGSGSIHTPSIASDGTVYTGEDRLYAINHDGTIKWTYHPGEEYHISSRSNAISSEGIIFLGVTKGNEGGDFVALNPDGTERWRVGNIANDWVYSSPSIGNDGTVYIGSKSGPTPHGYLYAFGPLDPDAPYINYIFGPVTAKAGIEHNFQIVANSPVDRDIFCYVDWGDGKTEEWIGPYKSNQKINLDHTWKTAGDYIIKARAKDTDNLWGPWKEFEINIFNARPKASLDSILMQFLDMFPVMQRILDLWR